ncbi:MAG TPA: hypothetical protein VED24_01930, partial [Candidatus Acidoferrum sp.]|nr:hypothetical protein [Candidatus Acidoferrum sp.]
MPPEYIAALKGFAFLEGVPLAECVRGMAHDEILKRGTSFRERGTAFGALSNAVKAWLMTYYACVEIAGQLPGKERRAELERLTWNAVKKAHEFIETEEAAKNAKHRILAIQAIALITRAEEEILLDMDRTEVDEIVKRMEEILHVIGKEADAGTPKAGKNTNN